MKSLFHNLKLGDTFEDGGKYIKISESQAMSLDFGIERYYPEDEVQKVIDSNERIYLLEGSSVGA